MGEDEGEEDGSMMIDQRRQQTLADHIAPTGTVGGLERRPLGCLLAGQGGQTFHCAIPGLGPQLDKLIAAMQSLGLAWPADTRTLWFPVRQKNLLCNRYCTRRSVSKNTTSSKAPDFGFAVFPCAIAGCGP